MREAGYTQLAQARMPTRRNEEFRFTDLAPLIAASPVAADPAAAAAVDAAAWTLQAADATRVVLIDGGDMYSGLRDWSLGCRVSVLQFRV